MKITLINAEWLPVPPVLGGAVEETVCETALAIDNHDLTVISPWNQALQDHSFSKEIFHHVDIGAEEAEVRRVLRAGRLPSSLRHPKAMERFCYLSGVSDLLEKIDPDVIQVHNRPQFIPFLLRRFPQKRMILYLHLPPLKRLALDGVFHAVDRVVFVSHSLGSQYASLYPKQVSKFLVIPNSVDTDCWRPEVEQKAETLKVRQQYNLQFGRTVLFMGRIVHHKGISYLLDAIALVKRKIPDVKLLVAGGTFYKKAADNSYLRKLKKGAARLGNTVAFTGYIEHAKTPYVYAAADVTVAPSLLSEAFGKVVAESMATGTPVIGSQRGAYNELIDSGDNGILVNNPRDPAELAQEIITLLQDNKRRKAMGVAARKKMVAQYSKPIRLAKVQTLYQLITPSQRFF